jgi:hypothetical protein
MNKLRLRLTPMGGTHCVNFEILYKPTVYRQLAITMDLLPVRGFRIFCADDWVIYSAGLGTLQSSGVLL